MSLTDGRTRQVRIRRTVIQLRHAAAKELPRGSRTSAMVFQALRHMGQDAVVELVIARLRRALSAEQRDELLWDARYTTDWIASIARRIGQNGQEAASRG